MSPPERKLKLVPSEAQLEALLSTSWPKERMCSRTLSVILDDRQHQQLVDVARERYARLSQKPPTQKNWADLEKAWPDCTPEDILKTDPGLLEKTVFRREYGGDMVLDSAILVGGYRFKPSTTQGLRMSIEKVKNGSVISKIIPLKTNETLKITDGDKTITLSLYGQPEDFMLEGVYICVE
jgi:hypothetical protein